MIAHRRSAQAVQQIAACPDNDHLVTAGDGQQYAFRLYQQGDRFRKVESDYSTRWIHLNFLKDRKLPVSPVRRRDGVSGSAGCAGNPVRQFSLAYGDPCR